MRKRIYYINSDLPDAEVGMEIKVLKIERTDALYQFAKVLEGKYYRLRRDGFWELITPDMNMLDAFGIHKNRFDFLDFKFEKKNKPLISNKLH